MHSHYPKVPTVSSIQGDVSLIGHKYPHAITWFDETEP